MHSLKIENEKAMSEILTVFSKLDEIRWNDETSKDQLINYCRDDLSADEKLLTHWLCYIMDRQMPVDEIWDIGGYIISHLVQTYTSNPHQKIWEEVMGNYIKTKKSNSKQGREIINYYLESKIEKPNDILERYKKKGKSGISDISVSFASRYMPGDLTLIYRTLAILHNVAERSMGRFLCKVLEQEMNLEQAIEKLAIALNQLTYEAGRRVSGANINERIKEIKDMYGEISSFKLNLDANDWPRFKRKRLWCALRDYLKSHEFNSVFVASLGKAVYSNPSRWTRNSTELKAALKVLELPGDKWNNSLIIREGLFSRPYIKTEKTNMPEIIRELYNEIPPSEKTSFYPEQLDITFGFVQRMCEASMCDLCFFGGGIKRICHQKEGLLCPAVLYSIDAMHRCNPSECDLKNDSAKNLCKMSRAKSLTS